MTETPAVGADKITLILWVIFCYHGSDSNLCLDKAKMVADPISISLEDAKRIDELYGAKFGHKDRLTEIKANLPEGRAYWVVKPDQIFFWDEVNFPDAPKKEFNLET